MAKIKPYKLVNTGALEKSAFTTVRAFAAPIKAINGIGTTMEGIGGVINDITSINKATVAAYQNIQQDKRRQLRLQRDAAAEARQEKATSKLKKSGKNRGKRKLKKLGLLDIILKKFKDGLMQVFAPILGPLAGWFGMIVGVLAARGVFDILTDEEKREKFLETFEKAKCVFGKIFNFVKGSVMKVWEGWQKLTGSDSGLIERITGLGEILTGVAGLLLVFNPFALFGGILDALFPDDDKKKKKKKPDEPDASKKKGTDVDADGKPKKPTTGADDLVDDALELGPDGKPKTPTPPTEPPKKRGGIFGFLDEQVEKAKRLKDDLAKRAESAFGVVGDWAKKQYANLSEAARKRWEDMVGLSKKLVEKSKAIGSAVASKVGDAKKFITDGVSSLTAKAKQVVMDKILQPLGKMFEPIQKQLKGMANKVMGPLFETPIGKKVLEALKKKGINGAGDFAGIAKRVGGKALPVIGGLVNMLFAYDRFANEDPFGGLLEALSAGFDLAGLFPGGQFGPPVSMGIDAYLFAIDLVPGVQEFEEAMINKIPGAKQLGDTMKSFGKKLPNLGQLIGMLGGKPPEGMGLEDGEGDPLDLESGDGNTISADAMAMVDEYAAGGPIASLYAGHADMKKSDPSGAFGTAGGRIVGGKYSSGLDGQPGGFVPAAKQEGYLSNEAYFNDKIAQRAAAKSGGLAVYRKPVRTSSGSDPKGNWKRGKADAARGMTSIEIHQDAPSSMGMAGTMGVGPGMQARGAKNSILKAINSSFGIHRAQRGLGFVGSNYKQTLLEIAPLDMKYLKAPTQFIESKSTQLANAIKAGAKGYDSKVSAVEEADLSGGDSPGSGDYTGDSGSLSADETSTSTPGGGMLGGLMNPMDALKGLAGKFGIDMTGSNDPFTKKAEVKSDADSQLNLDEIFGTSVNADGKYAFDMGLNIDLKSKMDYDNSTQIVFVEKPVAYTLNTAIPQTTEFKFGTTSSLLSK